MRRQTVFWWGLGLLVLFLGTVILQWPSQKVKIVMCDVGQGDAFLIMEGFAQVLIDGGPPTNEVLACLGKQMPFWDRKLELLVMTHPDSDHSGGLREVIKRYRVGLFLLTKKGLREEGEIAAEVARHKIKTVEAKLGMGLKLGTMMWRVGWPHEEADVVNDESVVMRLTARERTAVFTGDLGQEQEREMIELNGWSQTEVLKVGHHGSKTSTSDYFLERLRPQVALISVGKDNNYGHPSPKVIENLQKLTKFIYRTDKEGVVVLEAGNQGWRLIN